MTKSPEISFINPGDHFKSLVWAANNNLSLSEADISGSCFDRLVEAASRSQVSHSGPTKSICETQFSGASGCAADDYYYNCSTACSSWVSSKNLMELAKLQMMSSQLFMLAADRDSELNNIFDDRFEFNYENPYESRPKQECHFQVRALATKKQQEALSNSSDIIKLGYGSRISCTNNDTNSQLKQEPRQDSLLSTCATPTSTSDSTPSSPQPAAGLQKLQLSTSLSSSAISSSSSATDSDSASVVSTSPLSLSEHSPITATLSSTPATPLDSGPGCEPEVSAKPARKCLDKQRRVEPMIVISSPRVEWARASVCPVPRRVRHHSAPLMASSNGGQQSSMTRLRRLQISLVLCLLVLSAGPPLKAAFGAPAVSMLLSDTASGSLSSLKLTKRTDTSLLSDNNQHGRLPVSAFKTASANLNLQHLPSTQSASQLAAQTKSQQTQFDHDSKHSARVEPQIGIQLDENPRSATNQKRTESTRDAGQASTPTTAKSPHSDHLSSESKPDSEFKFESESESVARSKSASISAESTAISASSVTEEWLPKTVRSSRIKRTGTSDQRLADYEVQLMRRDRDRARAAALAAAALATVSSVSPSAAPSS